MRVLSDDAQIDVSYMANYRISTVFLNEESLLLISDKVLSTDVAAIRNEICTKRKYYGVIIKDAFKNALMFIQTFRNTIEGSYKRDQ